MPRPRRLFIPGASVHVVKRGNNRTDVFHDDRDFLQFLAILRHAAREESLDVHAFTLMTNHVHLIVTPPRRAALPAAMKRLFGDYTRYANRRYQRSGTIWDARYSPHWIDTARYWLTCLRYVERNPMAAGIVSDPADYPWSSYRAHALGVQCDWLVPHPVYLAIGATPEMRCAVYRALCAASSAIANCQVSDTDVAGVTCQVSDP